MMLQSSSRPRLSAQMRRRDEAGAYAILMSMTLVLVIALAAIAVDIAKQVETRQTLKDTMDAAAHAAVLSLPDIPAAKATALATARANGAASDPAASLWCVVASTGATKTPDQAQIPGTCNPDSRVSKPITQAKFPGMLCDLVLCFIPCSEMYGTCNTIRLEGEETVPYDFAPAIGYDEGSTGTVVTVACKGSCGTAPPNPMDVVVVADRTQSLSASNRNQMVTAIQGMLRSMDPSMHFVSLATIDKSRRATGTNCPSTARSSSGSSSTDTWVATDFSADYSYLNSSGQRVLRTGSQDKLAQAVACLSASEASWGTHLSAPLKAAARRLLGEDGSNLSSLSGSKPRAGEVAKVIIFETDGEPNEKSETVDAASDPGSSLLKVKGGGSEPAHKNGPVACRNFLKLADDVKAQGIRLITIGFDGAATSTCDAWNSVSYGNSEYQNCSTPKPTKNRNESTSSYNSRVRTWEQYRTQFCPAMYVRDVLAAAASPSSEGQAAQAEDCNTSLGRARENTDGDDFFCGVNGSEFAEIFQTAFGQMTSGVRLLRMPS